MTYIPSGGSGGGGTVGASSDVALDNPVNGQALTYDANLQKWKNTTTAADTSKLQAYNIYDTNSGSYPVRPTGYALVQWVGSTDPGVAAQNGDMWLGADNKMYRRSVNSTWGQVQISTVSKPSVPPATPTGLIGGVVSSSQIDWSWSASESAADYLIRFNTGSSIVVNDTTYTQSGLPSGSAQSAQVAARNSAGTSAFSGSVVQTTTGNVSAPSVPTSVTATKDDSVNSATVSWQPPATSGDSAITGYFVGRDGVDSNSSGPWSTTVSASTTTFTFLSLLTDTTYTFTVYAINGQGNGVSQVVSVTMGSGGGTTSIPSAPTSVTATKDDSTNTATLSWQPPLDGGSSAITGYFVGRDGVDTHGSGPWSTTVSAATRTFSFLSLATNTTYQLTVYAINGNGNGASAIVSISMGTGVPSSPPTTPTNVTAGSSTSSSLTVSWTASSTATSYIVERSSDGVSGWALVGSPATTSFTDTSLSASTSYWYRVAASNSAGSSPYSAAVKGTTTSGSGAVRIAHLHPFTSTSPWNLPRTTDAPMEAATDTRTAQLLSQGDTWANQGSWSHPVNYATTNDPWVTFSDRVDSSRTVQGYCPVNAVIAGEGESGYRDLHMHVVQPDGMTVVECFGVYRNTATNWNVGRVYKRRLDDSGIGPLKGVRAYGGSAVGGLIRSWEVDPNDQKYTGEINHAIAMAITTQTLYYSGTLHLSGTEYNNYYGDDTTQTFPGWGSVPRRGFMKSQGYQWPATEHDWDARESNQYLGAVGMGTYLSIPNAIDVATLPISTEGKMIARAIKKYGAYVTDRAGAMVMAYADHGQPAASFVQKLLSNNQADLKEIRKHLRVVTLNDINNPNGGPLNSASRPALIPEL